MFSKFYIFTIAFCVFLLKQIENRKTTAVLVNEIQFPRKWCLFQPSRSKTVGDDPFLAAKSVIF